VKNKLEDLRNHLFATLEALSDEAKPMELDRARAIADVAQVVINTAKAEIDFLRLYGDAARGSDFFPGKPVESKPIRGAA
jgi:hypothetical protein